MAILPQNVDRASFFHRWIYYQSLGRSRIALLRGPGEMGYKIPRGGLYRWISCPNYFGETIEWIGWAIATWSLPGLTFAVWTFANLAPRAHAHHKWYHKNFKDYPIRRKAFIPWVW